MNDEGLKISRDSKSVNDKTALTQVIDTKYKTFMSKFADKISYTFPDPMMLVEKRLIAKIDHNLGYIPQVTVKFSFDDIYYSMLPFFSYYQSRQICPGCLETCDSNWTSCVTNCDNNWNACMDNNLALFSTCLDNYPYEYPYLWDEWVAGCDVAYNQRTDACNSNWDACFANCESNYDTCANNCWSFANTEYSNSQLYFMADEQSVYIYFEIDGKPADSCGWPAGSFLNMQGRTFHFKYNISFSELKTSGEENGCNWQEFVGG